jgi:hypothetical protein
MKEIIEIRTDLKEREERITKTQKLVLGSFQRSTN